MPEPQRQERVVAALRQISEKVGRSPAQVALAWLRNRDVPVIPIIGARKLPQLEDNLACLSLALAPDQVERLNEASWVELGFPHDFLRREMVRAMVFGRDVGKHVVVVVVSASDDGRHSIITAYITLKSAVGEVE
jgi:hypothetical protein